MAKEMSLAEEIHDIFLDSNWRNPFTPDVVNDVLKERLYPLLCESDGMLSAIRHGRKFTDREIEEVYYRIREVTDDINQSCVHSETKHGKN